MPTDRSHPLRVKLDQALELVMSQRGAAVVPIAVGDTSMAPLLYGGDAVLLAPLTGLSAPGDVILFWQRDYWVVHRCLGPVTTRDGRSGLRTRGDGRNGLDPLVVTEDVRARVIGMRRKGAWRSLEGAPARAYARLMGWHDLFWAAAGVALGKAGLGGAIAAIDLGLLRLTVPIVFPLCHRRIAVPAASLLDDAV